MRHLNEQNENGHHVIAPCRVSLDGVGVRAPDSPERWLRASQPPPATYLQIKSWGTPPHQGWTTDGIRAAAWP